MQRYTNRKKNANNLCKTCAFGQNLLLLQLYQLKTKKKDIMNTTILSKDKDPMGTAILDYQTSGKAGKLRVFSSMFEEDEMPVKHLFRTYEDMPTLERMALDMAQGQVLDVGAGAGCHALALQDCITTKKILGDNQISNVVSSVKAIDISPLSCEAMKQRGIKDVENINLFDEHLAGGFDTILLLMNGTGIAGKISNLPTLFNRLKSLLNPRGQILIDSSDLKYVYENEDGSFDLNLNGTYYGEVDYQMTYNGIISTNALRKNQKTTVVRGETFNWLYIDFPLLKSYAERCGLHCELVVEGSHYDYLAIIRQSRW